MKATGESIKDGRNNIGLHTYW